PIPGLAENGIGFKQIEEAIAMRNQVLNKMDVAASTWDPDVRRRMLTFTFIGGGFAGIEAISEIEDMARAACKDFDSIRPGELWDGLGGYALEQLRRRGIDVKLNTFLNSAEDNHMVTSDGDEFDSDTLVWTAGVKANPVLADTDLPVDKGGRVRTLPTLQIVDEDGTVIDGAWAAGDCAAGPDLASAGPDALCGPTAQHAVRQARHLGDNIVRHVGGEPLQDYEHRNMGTVATLGLYKGVAQIQGIKFRGPLAWFMHRTYHM